MTAVRLINNLICALGSVTVALAIGVLLWLPARPWIRLQINLSADAQPISLPVTGYEAMTLAQGLTAGSQKVALTIGELSSREGGSSLLNQLEISERLQLQLRGLATQSQNFGNLVLPLQAAFFVLPALTLFTALSVMFTRGYFGQQLLKGLLLILLTFCTVVFIVGGMQVLSERLNAVINASLAQNASGFPGLGLTVNDALPELRVGLQNLMDTRTPLIAGVVALVGAVVALLGGCLSARQPALVQAQLAKAALLQSQADDKRGLSSPPSPTQRMSPALLPPPASQRQLTPRSCPTCGQPVSGAEKFCRNCGAVLQSASP